MSTLLDEDTILDESILDGEPECVLEDAPAAWRIVFLCCNTPELACEKHYQAWLAKLQVGFAVGRKGACSHCGARHTSFDNTLRHPI